MKITLINESTNQYAVSKTLRFGLTLKRSAKKNKSHQELDALVAGSEEKIKQEVFNAVSHNDTRLIRDVSACIKEMSRYLHSWQDVYRRTDQIALTKDFYKRMAKKACFEGFWLDNKQNKQPQSQIIKLSSLKKADDGRERKEYILDYWEKNLRSIRQKQHDFELILKQYESALNNPDKAHTKPHLVDFRKMFLSLTKLYDETLVWLNNDSICFPDLEKMADNERNETVQQFASVDNRNMRKELAAKIKELRDYFQENGGYVHYGRVTLNRHTVWQKPHKFNEETEEIIKKLQLLKIIRKVIGKTDDQLKEYFEFKGEDKTKELSNSDFSVVERAQMFKCKPIPVAVRFLLSEYLAKHYKFDKAEVDRLFEKIGEPGSIGQEYKNLQDKSDFDLSRYPLKLAFDYAWENVARSMYTAVDFPREHCTAFLKTGFGVDSEDEAFKLYADLLCLKDNLATLEHEENTPRDREKFIEKIQKVFSWINYGPKNNDYQKHQKALLDWLEIGSDRRQELKEKNSSVFKAYEKAKQQFGLLRGRQKNNIRAYKELTEKFKKLSVAFGKGFADLREKLREQDELNKITHLGIILEDKNQDRYALLAHLDQNETVPNNVFLEDEKAGEFKTYQVKSLTSKTLQKLIKNEGAYEEFHSSTLRIDYKRVKRDWEDYKNDDDLLAYVKDCLQNSPMACKQNWAAFGCDFRDCRTYEELEHELDGKAHILQEDCISRSILETLVNEKGCLLLPFVNQDITSEKRKLKNQFSKDWEMLFDAGNSYRLHPEFRIAYRQPTPGYPANKRYSRFQMIAHILCEYIPESKAYISRKQQTQIFNDKIEQGRKVDEFNQKIKPEGEFYVLGIDRGLKQLATLCVLNRHGQIQGGFEIYTRSFNKDKKQWEHSLWEKRAILDLSNLRAETTVEGKKVLVDLNSIEVKDKNGGFKDNQQKIKLKQLAYIRELQYRMQSDEESIKRFCEQYSTPEEVEENIGELISPYKEGKNFADLPTDTIIDMLAQYMEYAGKTDTYSLKAMRELVELDAAEDLKRGVVANMVGVIAFLLDERYKFNAFISLEDLCRAFHDQKDALTGDKLRKEDMTFKEQENRTLAGSGTYQFFEMQLLKKLFRMQKEKEIHHLVPAFRSTDNYEKIVRRKDNYVYYPFGIVHFVNPMFTSKKCPACASTDVRRNRGKDDAVICRKCGFYTNWAEHNEKNNELLKKKGRENLRLQYIKNGDDNGAYHIALKTLENLKKAK